ncbi:MAG: hypothetical protein JNN05_07830, partial [Candidatus Omnitrophica bacterium]|nr:hypothetical protein [Candidatus Omnitrophota bacterium]
MSEKLLAHLLRYAEESSTIKFFESDLVQISSSGFTALKGQKYLTFDQYDFEKEIYFDKKGNERFVRRIKGKWIALSTENPEISPLQLKDQNLNRYSLNVQPLVAEIKSKNNLYKNSGAVNDRILFIGAKDILKQKVGIYLGLFADEKQAGNELLSLKSKTDQYHKYFVLCPTLEIKSQDLLSKLLAEDITCLSFKECLNDRTVDFSKLKDKKDGQFVSLKTNKQIIEETAQDYHCADKVHVPGRCPRKKSNIIELNNNEIKIGDSLFELFLNLVIGAKKNKGGWVTFDTKEGEYQPFSNLRAPLKGALLKKNVDF